MPRTPKYCMSQSQFVRKGKKKWYKLSPATYTFGTNVIKNEAWYKRLTQLLESKKYTYVPFIAYKDGYDFTRMLEEWLVTDSGSDGELSFILVDLLQEEHSRDLLRAWGNPDPVVEDVLQFFKWCAGDERRREIRHNRV